MSSFWESLLGLDFSGIEPGSEWRIDWTGLGRGGDRVLLLLLGMGVLIWFLHRLYKKDGPHLAPGRRYLLVGLRFLAVMGLVAMLLEPMFVVEKTDHVVSNLIVLRDASTSMDLKDGWDDTDEALATYTRLGLESRDELRGLTRQELIERAMERGLLKLLEADGDRRVLVHAFADRMLGAGADSTPDEGARQFTAIGSAIEQAIAAYQGTHVSGVVLISDGQSNAGADVGRAATLASAARIPVNVLAAGTPSEVRNIELTRVDVPPVVFVRDPIEVRVFLDARGLLGTSSQVTLERQVDGGPWTTVGSETVSLGDDEILSELVFNDVHEHPGSVEYRARVDEVSGELTASDNANQASVKVIRQRMKVLLVAGLAFPEVQFMINTLMRDPGVDLSSWLMFADSDYEQKGNSPITRLPITRDEIYAYDAIILYDPDLKELPATLTRTLPEFVGTEGGGLVFVAGESATDRLFGRKFIGGDALLKLLPVYRDPSFFRVRSEVRLAASTAWRPIIEPHAVEDPVFRFADTREKNLKILDSLPQMYWHFPVDRQKPGATVLARHSDPRMSNQYGRHVVMATQLYGPGRTMWIGLDSTYRWRFLDEQYYDGFWARVVDRVGRGKLLGGNQAFTLSTDRTTYAPGSTVQLIARFRNVSDRDAGLDVLMGEVELANGDAETFTLTPVPEDPATYEGSYRVSTTGLHSVKVWASSEVRSDVSAASLSFDVEVPALEFARPSQDLPTLKSLVDATGGKVFKLSEFDQLSDAFSTRRVEVTDQRRQEMWDAPLFFGGALLALFLEWVLRKRHRMV